MLRIVARDVMGGKGLSDAWRKHLMYNIHRIELNKYPLEFMSINISL